jgi:hypothetical protein
MQPRARPAQILSFMWTADDRSCGADRMGGQLSRSRGVAFWLSWHADRHQHRIGSERLLRHVGEGADVIRWPWGPSKVTTSSALPIMIPSATGVLMLAVGAVGAVGAGADTGGAAGADTGGAAGAAGSILTAVSAV